MNKTNHHDLCACLISFGTKGCDYYGRRRNILCRRRSQSVRVSNSPLSIFVIIRYFYAQTWHFRWHEKQLSEIFTEVEESATSLHGFASISRRHTSLKPMIAAVNGPAYGGGMEIILNCDLVVASQHAVFALPEVKRGVIAGRGGEYLPYTPFHAPFV